MPEVVDRQVSVRGPQGMVESPVLSLELTARETVRWRTERTKVKIEEATPYRGVRELWEIPAGIVSLPLSFTFNVVDVLLFGYIPNELVNSYTYWTFAALNPALNPEDVNRVVAREVGRSKEVSTGEQQVQSAPLARGAVAVMLDGGTPSQRTTDAQGLLTVDLLELVPDSLAWSPRRVTVEVREPGAAKTASAQYYMDRQLAVRLLRAAPLLATTRASDASPEQLSEAVYGLERLGFVKDAARLQDELQQRLAATPEHEQRFRAALDSLYESGMAPASPDVTP